METIIYADQLGDVCPFCKGHLELDTIGTGNEIEHPSATCTACFSTFPYRSKPKPKAMDEDKDIPW